MKSHKGGNTYKMLVISLILIFGIATDMLSYAAMPRSDLSRMKFKNSCDFSVIATTKALL